MALYANVIVDISLEKLDKTFQYIVPKEMESDILVGTQVDIPFGNRKMTGYVVELTKEAEYEVTKLKPIQGIAKKSVAMESQLISLAAWMSRNYGSTMNQALKTVLPVKQQTRNIQKRTIRLLLPEEAARGKLALFEQKHYVAKARLLRELIAEKEFDYALAIRKLQISPTVIKGLEQQGILSVDSTTVYRNPVSHLEKSDAIKVLNSAQQKVVDEIVSDYQEGNANTYLLKGVTGSGKTEVYMELIARVLQDGRQAIVLIPEIALTFQTVMRFYNRFGNRVSIMNSRLSAGERYDQYLRAKNGDIDIMIGPRSALFTPFSKLGLIIIDEEHETSYKSETVPRYHAREVAIERARMNHASVVLGSATPSIESYYRAKSGEYRLLELKERVEEKALPRCEVIDLREELRRGNRSIFSERLQELIEDRLAKKQQIMLFINRRGVSGIVSCRACGYVVKCPHCDVSLSQHNNGKMICHYCGYEELQPNKCPSCGSKYISGFKAGTQKIEQMVKQRFTNARVLRMDFDTTRTKDSYEDILQAFGNHEADILIGTQMIVKGHDFANVTLVGILAADLSLHVSDYHASERTFQLLTQAAGRAGRGALPGEVVIQSYSPEHFAIQLAKEQNYEAFYAQEIEYRKMMNYPPVWNLLVILCTSPNEERLQMVCDTIKADIEKCIDKTKVMLIGPTDATIAKISDVYRKVLYLKSNDYEQLIQIKDRIQIQDKEITVQFDFNPMSGF